MSKAISAPADGTSAAKKERKFRYVPALWAALGQAHQLVYGKHVGMRHTKRNGGLRI